MDWLLKLIDFNDPFFRPLWIRVTIAVMTSAWAVFEYLSGSTGWALFIGAIAALSIYGLFIAFDPREPRSQNAKED